MKQDEILLAEIERRKKVLTVLGEGCIVGQRNATEYKLLCELEEFAKAKRAERTSEVTSEVTSEISEDMWEVSKQYALRQVLASTETKMSEQAYLDLRLFSGFELAVAHKDGANWQKQQMINKGAEFLRKCLDNGMWVDQFLSIKDKEAIILTFKEYMEEEEWKL